MTAPTLVEPVPGPRWTRKRFITMLADCYSTTGDVDIAAVAEYADVTATTVRRWIRGSPSANGRPAAAPTARIVQLQRGPDVVERRNQQQYEHALEALAELDDETSILPAWRQQGWLDEHTVAIVDIKDKPWRQVVITKANPRALAELRRRSAIVTSLTLPTRFHAQVLAHAVMTRQQAWRVHPSPDQLAVGRTQVWMADAPAVQLGFIADHIRVGPGRQDEH
jgi:hypothetical protein